MNFSEKLIFATGLLFLEKRVSYRRLRRELELDEESLTELRYELATVKRIVRDDGDLLVFEIEQSPMQGAKIEQKEGEDSATLTTPDLEVGSYTFVVAVKDDGYPSKIDRQEFEIEIEEPEEEVVEEPEPEFDPSLATYITGVVRNTQGVEQVFIHVKPTGELLRLAVGEAFEIGTIQGIVVLISEGKAVLEVNGEEQEFRPGQKLNAVSSRRSRR